MENLFCAVLEGLSRASEAANPQRKGDFEKDGLLHCGICRQQKQIVLPTIKGFPLSGKKVFCACGCDLERKRKEEEERRMKAVKELKKAAFMTTALEACRFDADRFPDGTLSRVCRNYVKHFDRMYEEGKGLLLFGEVGAGKTFYAACIANALLEREKRVVFTSFAEIARSWGKSDAAKEMLDSFDRASLLVIDDFMAERRSDYMSEIVHTVINARSILRKPLIVTTNYSPSDMKTGDDLRLKRVFSRILELCLPCECKGEDMRAQSLKKDFDRLMRFLAE